MIDTLWYGDGFVARAGRVLLRPAEALFRVAVGVRNALYDEGVLRSAEPAVPCLSVGNLTVGGTGKTPVAAFLAGQFAERGAHPALVLRGYGGDEPLVHRMLNPTVPVVTGSDREAAVADARAQGADVVVLDDAFQHRRLRRDADIVLLSADRWQGGVRLLPAGPFREPLGALRRASLALVTVKAAPPQAVEAMWERVRAAAPGLPLGLARLALGALYAGVGPEGGGTGTPLSEIRGARVLAIAGIGDPDAFFQQLSQVGVEVRGAVFEDHHDYSEADVAQVARDASGTAFALCTLKDAVKLQPRWPPNAPPLRWVSQRVIIERGAETLERLLARCSPSTRPHTEPADAAPPPPR